MITLLDSNWLRTHDTRKTKCKSISIFLHAHTVLLQGGRRGQEAPNVNDEASFPSLG